MIVGHDIGGMIAYAYLRHYRDAAGVVIIDAAIPGLDPWDDVIRNPYLWHFAFHAIPALPELLAQDRPAAPAYRQAPPVGGASRWAASRCDGHPGCSGTGLRAISVSPLRIDP